MHPEAKMALVRRVLRLVSNTLSEEDRAVEFEGLYAQLLRYQLWKRWFPKQFLSKEIEKLLDKLRGVHDVEIVWEQLDQFATQLEHTPWDFTVEVKEQDYRPLDSFTLKWRWIEAQYSLLPPDVLANIRPLVPEKAREVEEKISVFHPEQGFLPGTYQLVDEIESKHEAAEQIREWLRLHIPNLEEHITICWDRNNAVVTTGAILCDYWEDFCYPGSDDVSISPLTGEWVLWYWHEEVFFFGQKFENRP